MPAAQTTPPAFEYIARSTTIWAGVAPVLSTTARDCNNVPIPANPGATATIPIDQVVPASVGASVAQRKTGNGPTPAGTTDVLVSWSSPEAGATVAVWMAEMGRILGAKKGSRPYARMAASISPMPKMRITRFRL